MEEAKEMGERRLGEVKWGEKGYSGCCREEGGAGRGRRWQRFSELFI